MAERSIDTLDFASSLTELRAGGARLLTIRPADDPAEALLELPDGDRVRLRRTPVAVSRGDDAHGWHTGRAGMHYRDLIAERGDGRCVGRPIERVERTRCHRRHPQSSLPRFARMPC